MNEIKVSIEFSADTKALLTDILYELRERHSPYETVYGETEAVNENKPEHPAEEALPWDEQPTQAKPTATIEEIRSKVLQLTDKKAEVRDIIKEYATKVSDIPADKRAEVMDRLIALEG